VTTLDATDWNFLRSLFGAYALEFTEGQPKMRASTLQEFLELFLGVHARSIIREAMLDELPAVVAAEAGPATLAKQQGIFGLDDFCEVVKAMSTTMTSPTLKDVVSLRQEACGKDTILLARALKSMCSLPELPSSPTRKGCRNGMRWQP